MSQNKIMKAVKNQDFSKPLKNDELRVVIKEGIFPIQLSLIKDLREDFNFKIKKTQKKAKKGSPAHVVLELLDESTDLKKMIRLGAALEELKYKAASESRKSAFEAKKEEVNLMRLRFPKEIVKEFKEEFAENLGLYKTVGKGFADAEFQFNVSDCANRTQLVKRITSILDAVSDIKGKKRYARHKHEIAGTIAYLTENCSYMIKTKETLVHMLGSELISSKYATEWDSSSSVSSFLQKLKDYVFGTKQTSRYYLGRVIVDDQKYVVKLHKPKEIENEPIDFKDEIWKRYIYGEQVYFGHGITLVQDFQQEIIDAHNQSLNPKVPKSDTPNPPPPLRSIGDKKQDL